MKSSMRVILLNRLADPAWKTALRQNEKAARARGIRGVDTKPHFRGERVYISRRKDGRIVVSRYTPRPRIVEKPERSYRYEFKRVSRRTAEEAREFRLMDLNNDIRSIGPMSYTFYVSPIYSLNKYRFTAIFK